MMRKYARTTIIAAVLLLLSGLICTCAFAAEVVGLSVDAANHQGSHLAANLIDGNPATAWVGGGKGIGPGKWIEIKFPSPVRMQSMHVFNGNQGKGQFKKFRSISKGVILYPDETRQKFTLKPSPGEQKILLKPVTADSFRIIITGVAPSARDKAMGKAKVAVSEIRVYGEIAEGGDDPGGEQADDEGADDEGAEDKAEAAKSEKEIAASVRGADDDKKKKDEPVPAAKADKAKPAAKPAPAKPAPVKPAPVKPAPAPAPKAAPKPAPAPKAAAKAKEKSGKEKVEAVPVAKPKAAVKPAVRKTASSKQVKKNAPQKAAVKKASVKKPAPREKAKAVPLASGPGITRLRASVPVPSDKPLAVGVISPWLDLEFVAQIKRYFALLTTLHDSYPELFTADIRERERKAFLALQARMRSKKQFGKHHIAMLEHIGLSFDKPIIRGDSAMVRVHGPYRYYLENKAFEFPVNTLFSFRKEGGKWLINGAMDK